LNNYPLNLLFALARRLAFFTREIGTAIAVSSEHFTHAGHKSYVPSRVLHLQLCLVVADGLAQLHIEFKVNTTLKAATAI
jgi:hypothetical protein